jgi:hypothetical protein
VVWYAPSIFHGPLASALKKSSSCKGYLIIRDIFPEWAVDMGLMGRGLPYRFFDAVARYQYSVADVIGVQTPGNLGYFDKWRQQPRRKLEVLQNWLDKPALARCPIRVTKLRWLGEGYLCTQATWVSPKAWISCSTWLEQLRSRSDVGFLFVGRGSDAARLKSFSQESET